MKKINPVLLDIPDRFETKRLLLRTPRPGDGRMLYEAVSESVEHLKPWMPWAHDSVTVEQEEALARRAYANFLAREDMMLLLIEKNSNILVGGSGLHRFDWDVPRFEIGYWVRYGYEGRGFISEAVNGITKFAFEKLGAERVDIHMDDRNIRSWRVAERCDFKHEGTLRNHARDVNGGLRDTRIYSKIRSEWLEDNNIGD